MFCLCLKRCEVKIYLRSTSLQALDLVKNAFAISQLIEQIPTVNQTISLEFGCIDKRLDKGWWIKDLNSINSLERDDLEIGDFFYHLSERIIYWLNENIKTSYCFHAAAVAWQGKSIVIPAMSRSGKSSLTCWLVANGFEYITDELIITNESDSFQGLPKPILIKHHGLMAIKSLMANPNYYPGKLTNALLVSSLGGNYSQGTEHKLSMFIFPRYDDGVQFHFENLSPAKAGLVLMANNVNSQNHQTHGFKAITKLARTSPAYSLHYGGFDKLPEKFPDQLKALLENPEN